MVIIMLLLEVAEHDLFEEDVEEVKEGQDSSSTRYDHVVTRCVLWNSKTQTAGTMQDDWPQ